MKSNGSPAPVFMTDEKRSYFLTVLAVHPDAQVGEQVEAQVELNDTERGILVLCAQRPFSSKEIFTKSGYSRLSGNVKRAIAALLAHQFLAYTIPEKPKSSKQKYYTTLKGAKFLSP